MKKRRFNRHCDFSPFPLSPLSKNPKAPFSSAFSAVFNAFLLHLCLFHSVQSVFLDITVSIFCFADDVR